MIMKRYILPFALISVAATACGGAALPHDELADAKASVRAAEEVDADAYPTAAAHLKFARDQIEHAQQLMKEDDDEENAAAARMLERAQLDAEVAVERTKAEKERRQAFDENQKVERLSDEDDDSQALLEQ